MGGSAWQDGGRGVTIRHVLGHTPFGPLLLAASPTGICSAGFDESPADLARRFPAATLVEDDGTHPMLADALAAIADPRRPHAVPLDLVGTPFQDRVWTLLKAIPPGETRSYADLAAALGQPGATRAVGTANGQNPIAVLVPCHRVIRSDGHLGGYAGGLDRKIALLRAEGSLPTLL